MPDDPLADLLMSSFPGRADCYATQTAAGFAPVHDPLTPAVVRAHLNQQRCVGVYLVSPDQTVRCTACDWDGRHDPRWKESAVAVWRHLRERGIAAALERSQSGEGAHVWVCLSERVPAAGIRRWWEDVLAAVGVQCREIYPRQDAVAAGGLGNLLRLPLWRESRFVGPDWKPAAPAEAMRSIQRYSAADLGVPDVPAASSEADAEITARTWRLLQSEPLARRWRGEPDGLRGDQSLSNVGADLAWQLARAYVPAWEIEAALRAWGAEHGYSKASRADWLRRTVSFAYRRLTEGGESASTEVLTLDECVAAYLRRSRTRAAMYCGFDLPALDRSVDGVGYGELALVAARPSQGKTALALQWAEAQARAGTPVVFLSEEMSAWAIGARVWARMGGAGDVCQYLRGSAPVYVHRACNTIDRAVEVIEQHHHKDGANAVVVDYTQLLCSRRRRESHEEIADVSRGLKEVATRLEIAALAATQLNREPDKDRGIIRLSHLGGSGQLERDADLVVALARKSEGREQGYVAHCLKRRNGPIREAAVHITFTPDQQRFA